MLQLHHIAYVVLKELETDNGKPLLLQGKVLALSEHMVKLEIYGEVGEYNREDVFESYTAALVHQGTISNLDEKWRQLKE